MLLVVAVFSYLNGDHLVNLNDKTIRALLPFLQPFADLNNAINYAAFEGRIDVNVATAAAIADAARFLEDAIHVVLFFFLSLFFLLVFRKLHYALGSNIALSVAICSAFAYFSETVQNSVIRRGYEAIDVTHNFEGIALGVLAFLIFLLIRRLRKKKAARLQSPSYEIKHFLSDDVFM